jgi:hypothetical protein
MTEQEITARIAQLEEQEARLYSDLCAVRGALIDCRYWLAEVAKRAKDETPG